MRLKIFLAVAAMTGFATLGAQGCSIHRMDRINRNMDRVTRYAIPTATTAWSAMPTIAIATASTLNLDRATRYATITAITVSVSRYRQ